MSETTNEQGGENGPLLRLLQVETLAKVIYDAEGFHAADSWALETSINRGRCASYATAVLAAIDSGRVPGLGRVDAAKAEELREVADTWELPPCACPGDCDCHGLLRCRICFERNRPHVAGKEDHADLTEALAAKDALAALAAAPAPQQPAPSPLVALVREYADRHAITLPSEPGPDRRVVDVDALVEWLQGRDVVDREALGRLVREVWVTWAREQPDPKPSWLVGWDDLPEPDREVDRRIGEALYRRGALDTRRATAPARDPLEDKVRALNGAALIQAERHRQITVEGYDEAHDREHGPGPLYLASAGATARRTTLPRPARPHRPRRPTMPEQTTDAAIDREQGHDDAISVLRAAARHPHKGPRDTDASMLRAAAKRLRAGYEPGGSWTKQTVAKVIETVAALIEEDA